MAVFALHLTLHVTGYRHTLEGMRQRTPAPMDAALESAAATVQMRQAAGELLMLGAIALAAMTLPGARRARRRVLATVLLAYTPLALFSAAIVAALAAGRDLNLWVVAAEGADTGQVAATVIDALPVVLEPLRRGRHVANGAAALLVAVLLRRSCGLPLKSAAAAAAWMETVLTGGALAM